MKKLAKKIQWMIIMLLTVTTTAVLAQGPYPNTGDQSVCLGSTQPYGVINTPGSSYAWNIIPMTGGNGTITGNGNSSISVTWNSVGTCTLQVIETNSFGCAVPPVSIIITVHPIPDVNPVPSVVYCAGQNTAIIPFSGAVPGTTFAWTNSDPSIGLPASGSGTILSFTAINGGLSPVVATITITPTANACGGVPVTFTITVNPVAQVNDPADQIVCNGASTAPVAFTTINTGGTMTYTWVNTTPSIGLGAAGTGDIAAFPAINGGTAPVIATITVTPHLANGGITCNGPTQTFTITVNPTTTVNPVANAAYCDGAVTAAVPFSSPVTGTTYSWTNSDPSIGLAPGGLGDIPSFTATNPGVTPVVATINVTPSANGCPGIPISFTITVNPRPVPTIIGPTPVCQNSVGNVYTTELAMSNYSWTVTGGSVTAGSGTGSITVTWTASGTQTITVTYTNINGCNPASPTSYPVIVNPVVPTSPIYHN